MQKPRRAPVQGLMPRKLARFTHKHRRLVLVIVILFVIVFLTLFPGPQLWCRLSGSCGPWKCQAHRSDPNGVVCRPQDNRPPYPHMYDSPPPMETVQRRPSGAETRSALLTVATTINEDTCAHWMSALLSGFDVCTVGVGRSTYGHLDKFVLVKEAIETKKMRDWDVIFYADQDTIYTGQDIQPFVDEFIRLSPEHPNDINVRKIRRGEAVAPLRFMAEPWCTAIYSLGDRGPCASRFDDLDAAVERVAERDQFQYLPGVNSTGRGNTRFMNAGVFMARVWAVKELLRATPRYTKFFPFPDALQKCDQSIYTALYLDQRFEEAQFGLLAPQGHLANISRINQFGLHYGLIDIWQKNRAATLAMNFPPALHQLDGRAYGVNLTYPALSEIGSTWNRTVQAADLFRETRDPSFYLEERHLRYTHPLGVKSVPIAPPLLSLTTRPMDKEPAPTTGKAVPHIPALLHFADSHKSIRIVDNFPLTGWHIAMELVPGQRSRSIELLRTANTAVLTGNGTIEHYPVSQYCDQWITKYVVDGRNLLC